MRLPNGVVVPEEYKKSARAASKWAYEEHGDLNPVWAETQRSSDEEEEEEEEEVSAQSGAAARPGECPAGAATTGVVQVPRRSARRSTKVVRGREPSAASVTEEQQVCKLSAQTSDGGGGGVMWRGRLRGGRELDLEGAWVRRNFQKRFLSTVCAAGGAFVHVPTGRAREGPTAVSSVPREIHFAQSTTVNSAAECPSVAYRQGGADLCVAYGLASAVHAFGDVAAARTIAARAHAALASGDAFGFVRSTVRQAVPGWDPVPLPRHDPLAARFSEPVLMQLVGSDGAGSHAVATMGGLVFDATESWALPLSRDALDRCVGVHVNGATFSHVARAVRLVPGKSVRKLMRA
jgi:hypothetical protein